MCLQPSLRKRFRDRAGMHRKHKKPAEATAAEGAGASTLSKFMRASGCSTSLTTTGLETGAATAAGFLLGTSLAGSVEKKHTNECATSRHEHWKRGPTGLALARLDSSGCSGGRCHSSGSKYSGGRRSRSASWLDGGRRGDRRGGDGDVHNPGILLNIVREAALAGLALQEHTPDNE
jgi:predicted CxxxxCH...CXXCH cytochrome family protein